MKAAWMRNRVNIAKKTSRRAVAANATVKNKAMTFAKGKDRVYLFASAMKQLLMWAEQ